MTWANSDAVAGECVAAKNGDVGAFWQVNPDWVIPADLAVVIRQAGAKPACLDSHHGVGAGIVVGFAVEYLEANQILFDGISGAVEGLADNEAQKAAMARSLAEAGGRQNSSQFGFDFFGRDRRARG